ncbi:aquaporin-10 isoform 2-T2 [Leptodactylus fuscus]|uniref:aquaporin-10 isoform X1 n=1 Tax=Leptodactylus fuscus TaxID=238119 RepID=UPI003F4F3C82
MNMESWHLREWAQKYLRIRNTLLRECLAEFLGVFVLLFITTSAVAQGVTSSDTKGNFFCMYLAGAIAVVIAIYVSGGVSDAIHHYTKGNLTVYGPRETASIFSTYPAPYLSIRNGFLDQVMGTAMLMIGILAILDSKNKPVPKGLEPVVVGMLVFSIGLSMGVNCGYPINPSRDLGPRIFTYVAGWGADVFRAGNNWWWVPVVAPCVGGVLGSFIYQLLVEIHHPVEDAKNEEVVKDNIPEKWKEIPIFTVSMDNSLSHRL